MIITMIKFGQFEFPHFFGLLFFSSVKKCGKLQIDIRPTKLREFKLLKCVKKRGKFKLYKLCQKVRDVANSAKNSSYSYFVS